MFASILVEVLGCMRQICVRHHVVSNIALSSVSHNLWLHLVAILVKHHLGHNSDVLVLHFFFFPLDLELGNSGLLNKDVSCELADVWLSRWILHKFRVFFRIRIVHIVAHSEELLSVVV